MSHITPPASQDFPAGQFRGSVYAHGGGKFLMVTDGEQIKTRLLKIKKENGYCD